MRDKTRTAMREIEYLDAGEIVAWLRRANPLGGYSIPRGSAHAKHVATIHLRNTLLRYTVGGALQSDEGWEA